MEKMKNEFEETFLRKNYLSKGEVKILLKVQVHLWEKSVLGTRKNEQ